MGIAAHVEPVAPVFCSKLEAREAKQPNSESVEEMTHLSRTAFDAKQSTLRKLQKNNRHSGLQDRTWYGRLDNSPVAQAGVKLRCFKLAKSGR